MVFRFLMRWLLNNEQLVSRLAESYPMRRTAQWVVYLFNKTKAISDNPTTEKLTDRLKQIRDELKKKSKQ